METQIFKVLIFYFIQKVVNKKRFITNSIVFCKIIFRII